MNLKGDDTLLSDAKRVELDAAIALACSFACCALGLVLRLRSLRTGDELLSQIAGRPGSSIHVQSRAYSARSLALAAIVVAIAVPLTAALVGTITTFVNR